MFYQGRFTESVVIFSLFLFSAFFVTVGPAAPGVAAEASTRIMINANREIGRINPNIYGHFAEHLGNCIYGGIWVGPESEIENVRGIRTDVVEALKEIKPPIIRWPGGCFADSYHWRDGIGPREKRPKTVNVHWGRVIENNHFGTHEFIDFCRQAGAEPMIAANVGSGTPEEMRDWLEYLNRASGSSLAELRARHGHPDPFNVRYICIGNENWGCGGGMDPVHYGRLYRRFSEFCHFQPEDEGLYRVACGPSGGAYEWTENFFRTVSGEIGGGRGRLGQVQAFDMHYYTGSGTRATEFSMEQYYNLLAKSVRIEDVMNRHWEIMGRYDRGHRAKLAVCEWGTWHKVIPGTNPRFLRQQNTIRDALVAALTLNIFNRNCEKVDMGNIAQTVNVLQCMILTRGAEMIKTPTYYVFKMFVPHQGARALETIMIEESELQENPSLPRVTASGSLKDGVVTVSLVNTHAEQSADVSLDFRGINDLVLKNWQCLCADDVYAHNTFEQPEKVRITEKTNKLAPDATCVTLPPASVNVLRYEVQR